MTSSSQSGTGGGGLLGSIGRLFGGGRNRVASGAPADENFRLTQPEPGGSAEAPELIDRPAAEAPEAPASDEAEEEEELVLGPSLKAPGALPEPKAESHETDDGSLPDGGTSGASAEQPGSAVAGTEPEEDEEDILARLRALREEQEDAGDAVARQQATPSEDTWAASFRAADTDPAEERTGLAEDAETSSDDEGESSDESWPAEPRTPPGGTPGSVPLFAMREPEETVGETRPASTEDAGDEPVSAAGAERESGIRKPGMMEPHAAPREPAAEADEDGPEPTGSPEAATSGGEDEAAEVEVAEPASVASALTESETAESAGESEDAESQLSTPETKDADAEPSEAGQPVAHDARAEGSEKSAATSGEAELAEESVFAPEDGRAAADAEAVAPDDAEVTSPGTPAVAASPEVPGRGQSDEATVPDEAQVEEIVRRLIREELEGELGARLSANIRRVVREEVSRALSRDR